MKDGRAIEVTVLDRTLKIACKEDEKADLLQAVAYLDAKMREVRDNGKVLGAERVAIMAALNIAHELLTTKVDGGFDLAEIKGRMNRMETVIDQAMSEQSKLF